MTSGDPTAPKPTAVSRSSARSVAKKPNRPVKTAGAGTTRGAEPRVSVSKAGASALKRITRATDPPASNEDVLERLARLGDPAPAAVVDGVVLPPIVEADPTFPPVDRPSSSERAMTSEPVEEPTGRATDGPGVVARQGTTAVPGDTGALAAPVVLTSSSPATMSGDTVVSADLPTALVAPPTPPVAAPAGREVVGREAAGSEPAVPAVPAVAVHDSAAGSDSSMPRAGVARTDVAPVVPAPPVVPIEPPVVPVPEAAPSPVPSPLDSPVGAGGDGTGSVTLPLRRLKTPVVFRRARPRVRRVTRVVRHVDTWSVFKVALVFNVILYLCCLTSGVLLWNVAHATGTVDNIEKFFEQFGWESFEFKGGEIYHNAWIGGLFVAVGLTGFAVLLATLFNLITDLVGGIRVSVLEEEVVAKPRPGDPTDGVTRPLSRP